MLALLVLGRDDEAAATAGRLAEEPEESFPRPVAEALAALAAGDGAAYEDAVARVLESFESREEYLEGIPVADTVIVLQALAEHRGIAAELRSPLLPEGGGRELGRGAVAVVLGDVDRDDGVGLEEAAARRRASRPARRPRPGS